MATVSPQSIVNDVSENQIPVPVEEVIQKPQPSRQPKKSAGNNGTNGSKTGRQGGTTTKRSKGRSGTACMPCEVGKRKCNGERPCERCTRVGKTDQCVDGHAAARRKNRTDDNDKRPRKRKRKSTALPEMVPPTNDERNGNVADFGYPASIGMTENLAPTGIIPPALPQEAHSIPGPQLSGMRGPSQTSNLMRTDLSSGIPVSMHRAEAQDDSIRSHLSANVSGTMPLSDADVQGTGQYPMGIYNGYGQVAYRVNPYSMPYSFGQFHNNNRFSRQGINERVVDDSFNNGYKAEGLGNETYEPLSNMDIQQQQLMLQHQAFQMSMQNRRGANSQTNVSQGIDRNGGYYVGRPSSGTPGAYNNEATNVNDMSYMHSLPQASPNFPGAYSNAMYPPQTTQMGDTLHRDLSAMTQVPGLIPQQAQMQNPAPMAAAANRTGMTGSDQFMPNMYFAPPSASMGPSGPERPHDQ